MVLVEMVDLALVHSFREEACLLVELEEVPSLVEDLEDQAYRASYRVAMEALVGQRPLEARAAQEDHLVVQVAVVLHLPIPAASEVHPFPCPYPSAFLLRLLQTSSDSPSPSSISHYYFSHCCTLSAGCLPPAPASPIVLTFQHSLSRPSCVRTSS